MAVRPQTSEHILLESEAREVPDWDRAQITHAALKCRCRLRMRQLELALIDYYYLAVRMRRPGKVRNYVLDLHFVDRSILATRHVPWKTILATLALAGATVFSIRQAASPTASWWGTHRLLLCGTIVGLTACSGFVCAWRMTETLSLRSLHGGASLLEFIGGLGTLRSSRAFVQKLAAHMRLAAAGRQATKAGHLRDEMREHFRLKEAGVLSREQYEASKAQILAQHATIQQPDRL